MSDQRKGGIAWTEQTWNPIRGCSRVSEGCRNCYAETVAARFSGPGQPYEGLVRLSAEGKHGRARWNGQVRFLPEKLVEPLRWTRPRRVFVNSMSDLFHEAVPFEQIAAIFGVMAAAPQHTFQVLTKRPERMREWFRWVDREAPIGVPADPGSPWWRAFHCFMAAFNMAKGIDDDVALAQAQRLLSTGKFGGATWPIPNVWLGVSVEDQASADARIPLLLETPAAVRWVSYEPAIGPVDFTSIRISESCTEDVLGDGAWSAGDPEAPPGLDWIVVGGESGPGARPFDLAWARSVIEQTRGTGCKVFVKQLGARPTGFRPIDYGLDTFGCTGVNGWGFDSDGNIRLGNRKGGNPSEWPEDLRVREWPEVKR